MTAPSAYLDALRMLARRELSEAQIRQRLARRGHDARAIDDAVRRLKDERALDDTRVAEAIARLETSVRRHGRLRVRRAIEQAGIDRATARRAVDGAFANLDPDTLVEEALARRLRGTDRVADDREAARLYRYLVSQGFESDRALRAIDARRKRR
jgi:regulatory protein